MKGLAWLVLPILLCAQARAAIITYTDRSDWARAVEGPIQTETFHGFAADASFRPGPVAILGGSIVEINGPSVNGDRANKIDVPPFEFYAVSPNVTAFALIQYGGVNATMVRIDFDRPISAWGADFFLDADPLSVLDLFDTDLNSIGVIGAPPLIKSFYGFHLDAGEAVSSIVFRNQEHRIDGHGMDNMSFVVQQAVPEPSSGAMALLGLAALFWNRRRVGR